MPEEHRIILPVVVEQHRPAALRLYLDGLWLEVGKRGCYCVVTSWDTSCKLHDIYIYIYNDYIYIAIYIYTYYICIYIYYVYCMLWCYCWNWLGYFGIVKKRSWAHHWQILMVDLDLPLKMGFNGIFMDFYGILHDLPYYSPVLYPFHLGFADRSCSSIQSPKRIVLQAWCSHHTGSIS